jgi:2-polyprenyl-3-methyl-5-hydroxy-6-metoxy-1,4-benzoquinol methylase
LGAKSALAVSGDLRDKIYEANVEVHRFEAGYYELIHPEVYSKREQKRIGFMLAAVDRLVSGNQRKALDFGAGTGNLTGKLLRMGYSVTAIDISAEMCAVLKKRFEACLAAGKLAVLNSPIEDVSFGEGEFDLVTCYSVLHHLPDYAGAVSRLSGFLKKGGVMYLDHEPSPFYWETEAQSLAHLVKSVYLHSNPLLNTLYFRLVGATIPSLDYALSDYWHKKEHPLDHGEIEHVFESAHFEFFRRMDYHLTGSWIWNPLFYLYMRICLPEMSLWVAKK